MTRLAAVQRCPVVPNPPQMHPSSASSRLASSSTMMQFLPAHLEVDLLEVRGGILIDQAADGRGAR